MLYGDLIDLDTSLLQNTQVSNVHSTIIYCASVWCKKVAHRYINMNNTAVDFKKPQSKFYFN